MIESMKTEFAPVPKNAEARRTQRLAEKEMNNLPRVSQRPRRLGVKLPLAALLLCVLALIPSASHAQTNDLTKLLQQGLFEEQANRNLDAAIADYQSLAAQFDKDRQLAATAIFRLGECYRMQGKTNEAALEYQRIANEFSDQTPLVTLSRQNLAGLGPVPAAAVPVENSAAKLWDKVKNLPQTELEKVLPTLVPDATLTQLLQQRGGAETKLAELRVDYSTNYPDYQREDAVLKSVNRQIEEKIDGIMQALKMRAELPQTAMAAATPSTDEDQEIQRIQQMIQNSPDLINHASGDEGTPLFSAASKGEMRVAGFLLDHGADVNAPAGTHGKIWDTWTPLMAAADYGHKAMVDLLLTRGADVNWQNKGGETALYRAVLRGFQAVTEVLLANHADVKARNISGATPLFSAVQSGQAKIVRMLLAAGTDVNLNDDKGRTVLNYAIGISPEIFQVLLEAGTNPNTEDSDGRTPLSYAVERDNSKVVKLLLTAKADPNGGKLAAPLLCAINKNDAVSAKLLLQAGANPDKEGNGNWDVKINGSMHWAAGHPAVTPIFLAVSMNQFPLVQLLLKFKADPNDSKTDGQSLLFNALSDTNILEALLDAGAKVDAMGVSPNAKVGNSAVNWTALGEAAQKNNAAAVEILLKNGANPNLRDSIGSFTPLHWAANSVADRKVFELLLDYKADRNVRDINGQTPLDILKEKAKPDDLTTDSAGKKKAGELADLLRQHGALDNLPDWDRITVSRPSANFSQAVFWKAKNDWNRFTLLEAILNLYQSSHSFSGGGFSGMITPAGILQIMQFPDLARITILRHTHGSTNETRIPVNLLTSTNGVDCSKDVPLEFGDVVEIPERNHALGDQPIGLTVSETESITDYLKGSVLLVTHDQKVKLPIYPSAAGAELGSVMRLPDAQKVLLSSSDLSRVKVTRRDAQTGKTREWIVDCSPPQSPSNGSTVFSVHVTFDAASQLASDLWLRDGDVIEVPEKP